MLSSHDRLKVIFIIGLSFLGIEIMSQVVMAYQINIKCQFLINPIFLNLDYEKKSQMCNDLKSLKYNVADIRLNEPNQHYATININSEGFRGEEFAKVKGDDEFRIAVVGSSMIFGLGSTSDETTIPSILQKKMNTVDEKITVINAGIIAANSASETYLIKNILPQYDPDLIIVYEGYNDSFNIPIPDVRIGISQKEVKRTNFEKFVKNNFDMFATPKLVYQKTHDYFEIHETNEIDIKENAQLWKKRWKETCVSQDQIPIIILMQPVVGAGEKPLTLEESHLLNSEKHHSILTVFETLVSASKELEPFCEQIYDITGIFDYTNEHVYVTSAHLTDNGNAIIAQKMFDVLSPFLNKDF